MYTNKVEKVTVEITPTPGGADVGGAVQSLPALIPDGQFGDSMHV